MSNDDYTLANDGKQDISFSGESIASANSKAPSGPRSSRWTELELFRTEAGALICHRISQSQWQGEGSTYETEIVANEEEVVSFFGLGNLAKELYSEAGIDCAKRVA